MLGSRLWVQAVQYDLFSVVFLLLGLSLLILSLPLLGLGSNSTSLSPWFCVHRRRQYDTICWEFYRGWSQWMWLVSCRRQGMLTQGPATRSQVWVESTILPYTSTSITLPQSCQGYYDHCIATSSDMGMRRLGVSSFILGFGCWHCGGSHICFLFFVLFSCCGGGMG